MDEKEVMKVIPLREMQNVSDFKGLSQKMIELLAENGEVRQIPAGEYLFCHGDPARTYYVIREGTVLLLSEDTDGTPYTEEAGPGMSVGCSCLAGLRCYSCHAVCAESCKLLCWSQSTLRHLFNQNCRLGYLMLKAAAKMMSKRVHRKTHTPRVAYA
jgi:CRP-like cAMP-binding protein